MDKLLWEVLCDVNGDIGFVLEYKSCLSIMKFETIVCLFANRTVFHDYLRIIICITKGLPKRESKFCWFSLFGFSYIF